MDLILHTTVIVLAAGAIAWGFLRRMDGHVQKFNAALAAARAELVQHDAAVAVKQHAEKADQAEQVKRLSDEAASRADVLLRAVQNKDDVKALLEQFSKELGTAVSEALELHAAETLAVIQKSDDARFALLADVRVEMAQLLTSASSLNDKQNQHFEELLKRIASDVILLMENNTAEQDARMVEWSGRVLDSINRNKAAFTKLADESASVLTQRVTGVLARAASGLDEHRAALVAVSDAVEERLAAAQNLADAVAVRLMAAQDARDAAEQAAQAAEARLAEAQEAHEQATKQAVEASARAAQLAQQAEAAAAQAGASAVQAGDLAKNMRVLPKGPGEGKVFASASGSPFDTVVG